METTAEEAPLYSTLRRGPEVTRLVAAFAGAVPGLCRDVVARVDAGDLPAAAALAHRLKGSAAGYGFAPLYEVASALEQAGRAGDGTRAAALTSRLLALGQRVRAGAGHGERLGDE